MSWSRVGWVSQPRARIHSLSVHCLVISEIIDVWANRYLGKWRHWHGLMAPPNPQHNTCQRSSSSVQLTLTALNQRSSRCDGAHWNSPGLLVEARVLIDDWWNEYNTWRPHSSLGGLTPMSMLTSANTSSNRHTHDSSTNQRGPVTGRRDEDPRHGMCIRALHSGCRVAACTR